jgi:hypothetical protein
MTTTTRRAARIRAVVRTILTMAVTGAIGCDKNATITPTSPTTPTAATITSIVVSSTSTSAASFQLAAAARMSDGTSRDVTSTSTWESSNPSLATVSPGGLVTVVGTGELDVRATYQGVTGTLHMLVAKQPIVSVTITGTPSAPSAWAQLSAVARLSDGSTQDVTRSAAWMSSNPSVATVSAGYVTGLANGEVDVAANYQGVTATTHVTIAMPRSFTISGVVTEPAPGLRAVAGARVQIVGGSFATTDDSGRYSIPGVPEGRELIEVSKQGYTTYEQEIVVSGDMQYPVTLVPSAQ